MMDDLEKARAEAAAHRAAFLRLHRECCEEFGKYCVSMGKAQALTSAASLPLLGGLPELENKLAELLIKESPVKMARRSGLEVTRGWGWDKSTDVLPLVRV
jgi:hypothetical protein